MKADVIKLVDPKLNDTLRDQMIAIVNESGEQINVPIIDNHPDSRGLVVLSPTKPNWGSMTAISRVYQWNGETDLSRFVDRQIRIRYTVDQLREQIAHFDLHVGDDVSVKIQPTRIIVVEQLTPFNPKQQPKMNPTTGNIMLCGDKPIYRKTIAIPVNEQRYDTFIKSTGEGVSLDAWKAQAALDSKESSVVVETAPVVNVAADASITK